MKHEVTSLNTKRMLAESMKKAMRKKPFSKVTVSEIIKDCGVNRATFYYHFADTYDLLEWILKEEAVEVVKQFDLLVDYEEAILFVIDYIRKNEYMLNCVYDSVGREQLKKFLFNDFIDVIKEIFTRYEEISGKKLDPEYKDFLTVFYAEALGGMMIDMLKKDMSVDETHIVRYIEKLFLTSLDAIFYSGKDYDNAEKLPLRSPSESK